MKTKESIDSENYYFTQIFYRQGNDFYAGMKQIVVFASNPDEAERKVRVWCAGKEISLRDTKGHDEKNSSIYFYHKNYKRDSRKMVEDGDYIV